MFADWKQEKTVAALVEGAQTLADMLAQAKPHVVDRHAAIARLWAARQRAEGAPDPYALSGWPARDVARLVAAAPARIVALRKARDYDGCDGLAIWLHTARAVTQPRIAPPVRRIWALLAATGETADLMTQEMIRDAELPDLGRSDADRPGGALDAGRRVPDGFGPDAA